MNFKKYLESLNEELSANDFKVIEAWADKLGAKFNIDVEFTRHFKERANDERNKKPITVEEMMSFFTKTMKKYGGKIKMMADKEDAEAVLNDLATDINLPFVASFDPRSKEIVFTAKTVMRKKNFKTSASEPKLTFK